MMGTYTAYMSHKLKFVCKLAGICTSCRPYEAAIIGAVGSIITSLADRLLWSLKIDDPVGVIPVHACCSVWGLIAVGKVLQAAAHRSLRSDNKEKSHENFRPTCVVAAVSNHIQNTGLMFRFISGTETTLRAGSRWFV